jgi:hypothetical protein
VQRRRDRPPLILQEDEGTVDIFLGRGAVAPERAIGSLDELCGDDV